MTGLCCAYIETFQFLNDLACRFPLRLMEPSRKCAWKEMASIDKKITIKDIARIAKVSPATVSMVVNDRPGVSEETKYRVLRIVQALQYTPNLIARSLVKRHSNFITMLITNISNPVFAEIACGVDDVLRKHEYTLSIILTYDDRELETKEIESVLARGMNGLLTCAPLLDNSNIAKLVENNFPVVSILRRVYNCDDLDYVIVDSTKGAYLATEHLIRLGHKKIGFIKGPSHTSSGIEKQEGSISALKDYGLTISEDLIQAGDYSRKSGYLATNHLLKMGSRERPTAIFAANDHMAIGAFEAIWDAGLKTPEDMALVGFNDVEATSLRTIEITTIAHPKRRMGQLAAKRLIDKIEEKEGYKDLYQVILEPELVIRKSCGFTVFSEYVVDEVKHRSLKKNFQGQNQSKGEYAAKHF